MTDNTQVNTGTGDTVRDIDRSLNAVPIAAKTQVVQLDAGGQNAESLVSTANPLPVKVGAQDALTGGMPVNDANTAASLTSDQPLFASIAGDPSGDFAGVNLLEEVIKDGTGLNIKVNVVNPPKQDAQGAQVASDAPAPINLVGAVGQFFYIDTTGYQSLDITTAALTATINTSNDGITWSITTGYLLNASANTQAATITATTSYIFPVTGRWFRIQVTTAGSAVAYLRNVPIPLNVPILAQNINQVGGTAILSAGLAGVLPAAGPTANAIAPTANPNLIAGIDSGTPGTLLGVPLTRRVLTDNTGRLRLAPETPVQSNQNAPALNIIDSGRFEDQDQYELLSQILLELRINNQYMAELPNKLYSAVQTLQLPTTQQYLFAGTISDEPSAFRNDPTIFNQ